MFNHFVATLNRNLKSWLVYAVALFIIQVALAAVFQQAGTGLPGGMGMLINLLPDAVREFVGSRELDLLTANGMLAVSYNHPLSKLMLCVFAVGLTANAIAGELERGTLDLLLARPLRRYELLLGSGLAFAVGCVVLGGVMLAGTWVGAQVGGISAQVRWNDFYWLALNAMCLMLAMGGMGYLFSTLMRRGGQAVLWTGSILAAMFFVGWFATMWNAIKPLAPLTLFYYYRPEQIVNGELDWWLNIPILLTATIATYFAAIVVFERRDLTR